jgi:hypothetical protein
MPTAGLELAVPARERLQTQALRGRWDRQVLGIRQVSPFLQAPGNTRYPLHRRLGGPLGRSRQVQKISPAPGFDPRSVQSVASPYTD